MADRRAGNPGVMDRSTWIERAVALLRPLLNYARGELRAHEALGNVPPGAVSAEDVVDAGLLEALRRSDEAPDNRLYPWLRRFVRRDIARVVSEAYRRRREHSLEQSVGTDWPDDGGSGPPRRLIDVLPDPTSPIPEQVVEDNQLQQGLSSLLNQLPSAWREPFVLHVRDGLSLRQVAQVEGLPVADVRRRIERAREFLQMRLAEEYEDAAMPPPTEELFDVLERVDPTPEHMDRIRRRLETMSA
jgi:RNA polymerase sigma factor (sigma-70 family)